MVGGRPLAKIGDIVNCGSIIISGAAKVRIGEAVPVSIMPSTVTTSDGTIVNLPESYSTEAVAPLVEEAGRYAVFDDPDSIDMTPSTMSDDNPKSANGESPVKAIPDKTANKPPSPPVDTPVVGDCANIKGIDYNMMLSKHFSLANFSTKALFKHAIQAQAGFTEQQIICNLQGLAQNVLEKIWDHYPNFRINSGFRTFTVGKSQHEKGQACDIQWPGITNAEYKVRAQWIRDNLIYDQLLFEHGNMIWIHVSFNRNHTKQRQDVRTMFKGEFEPGIVLYYN